MKKPQEIIGDFIRLNSESLNNMQRQAPDVAKAFAEVIKLLAVKYGNIPMPTSQTTTSTTSTPQLLAITKEMMLDILGDVITKDEKYYVIDRIKFEDEFGDSFSCTIYLTEISKKRRKTLEFKLDEKALYYVITYEAVSNPYDAIAKLREESLKQGFTIPLDSRGKKTNIHNLLSSMPFYKFKLNGKSTTNYSYFRKNLNQINSQKQEWSVEYGFVNENNGDERIFVFLEDIVDYLFNFELNVMLYEKNKSKKVKCESLTYLIPVLANSNTSSDFDYREEFIGTKMFFDNDLVIKNGIATRADITKFWQVTKITDNKKKRKAFEIQHPETKETKTIFIDLEDLEKTIRSIYSGYARISGQSCLIQSKFDDYTIQEFFPKLRTYSEFEWQGVTNPYIYQYQNYHYDSDRFELRKFINYEMASNNFYYILNNLKTPAYIENILKETSFSYSYYDDKPWIQKIFLLFENNTLKYKGQEIYLNDKILRFKAVTYLEVNNNQDSFYNKFSRKLQDLPVGLGDGFMYRQNFEYPEQESEIYLFRKFEDNILYFEYRPGGRNVDYKSKTIEVDKFVKDIYVGNSKVISYKKEFFFWNSDIFQEFFIGESYPFLISGVTKNYKILSRRLSADTVTYLIEGEITGTQHSLCSALNPQDIKAGDDVIYIGKEKRRQQLYRTSNEVKRIFVKEIGNNKRYSNDLSSLTIQIAQEKFNGVEEIIGYSEYLFDYSKPPVSQMLTNTTQPTQQPIQDTFGLKIGDDLPKEVIVKWTKQGQNYYDENNPKWSRLKSYFGSDRKIESFKVIDGILGFKVSGTSEDIYLRAEGFKDFLEQQTNKAIPVTRFKQRILTIPETLSKNYNISYNLGDRTGPSQSASELRVAYENTQYEDELKDTYFVGNDGNWYRLKEDSRGTWTWKKDEPPVQTTTINKQYNSMSQSELKERYKDIQEAMAAFDEEDEEYKELKLELETLDLYIE